MKKLLLTVCVLGLLSTSANAQCTYRMNDVGRFHGYLDGPCNGAALNYAGAYPSRPKPNPQVATTKRGLAYDSQGRFAGSYVLRGNVGTTYDRYGRVESTVVKHGNSVTFHNRNGRSFTTTSVNHGNTLYVYRNGRLDHRTVNHGDGTTTSYNANGSVSSFGRRM